MARPKGYANWKPGDDTRAVLAAVNEVLDDYSAHLPLTLRQVFYRLVGQYGYDKTEKSYKRLGEYVVRARRAGLIPFSAIRDDGTVAKGGGGFDSVSDFWDAVRSTGERYRRDRQDGQPVYIELACEAAGMVPQMQRVATPFSVPVYSGGGFNSLTVVNETVERVLQRDVPTVFLHVGDYDPSGESIFSSFAADVGAFVRQIKLWEGKDSMDWLERPTPTEGCDFKAVRLALTEGQVEEFDLPTAPPKATDTRSRNWRGDTCQAEALRPDDLAAVVRQGILAHLDQARYDELLEIEETEREEIGRKLDAVDTL